MFKSRRARFEIALEHQTFLHPSIEITFSRSFAISFSPEIKPFGRALSRRLDQDKMAAIGDAALICLM
jgi:hypothetical protein